ncbi:MAG: hypothetical protein KDJ14_05035 [Xanthomonadales bacterium]|nr:hypothetical protein [Xanthomonadales bacterium]
MVSREELEELKRMCLMIFLELQEIRRRLEIEPLGVKDSVAYDQAMSAYRKQFEEKMRMLMKQDSPR